MDHWDNCCLWWSQFFLNHNDCWPDCSGQSRLLHFSTGQRQRHQLVMRSAVNVDSCTILSRRRPDCTFLSVDVHFYCAFYHALAAELEARKVGSHWSYLWPAIWNSYLAKPADLMGISASSASLGLISWIFKSPISRILRAISFTPSWHANLKKSFTKFLTGCRIFFVKEYFCEWNRLLHDPPRDTRRI